MKIGLLGYGKMGTAVEAVALRKGHDVVCRICSSHSAFDLLKEVDVCVDFTEPSAVWTNLQKIAKFKKNIIIGTSGWQADLHKAKDLALKTPFGLLYSSNFSMGIHLFKKLFEHAKKLTEPFGFDMAGVEMHHHDKKDAPSGTAKLLSGVPFASVRCGNLFGMHQIIFNAGHDTIELIHRSSGREEFARGAVAAAEWIQGKVGVWTFDDFIEDVKCNLKELLPH